MPNLNCHCGQTINYGQIPCQDEWLLINDATFDAFSAPIDAEEFYQTAKSLLKCNNCSRLYIFWHGFQHPPQIFAPEQNPPPKTS
ncbi:MAG TPA: hypothetical protein VLL52_13160 [Anaerolineae bacterium]|nr:hypothetical protein [Anaerolineae bacterium]